LEQLFRFSSRDSRSLEKKEEQENTKQTEKENEEKNHTILTWKMSASLKQTEINELTEKITCLESDSHNEVSIAEYDELKDELDQIKKMNQKNYQEKEKLKTFITGLKINVVKLDLESEESDEDDSACYFDGKKIESILP